MKRAWLFGALAAFVPSLLLARDGLGPAPTPAEPNLARANPGQTIRLDGLSLPDLPPLPVSVSSIAGPPLLLADQPEYFPGDGISLKEEVRPGPARLYLYQVPSAAGKGVTAVIENLSRKPLRLHWLRYSLPKPGNDYYRIGKEGLIGYLQDGGLPGDLIVPRLGRAVIDPRVDQTPTAPNDLVHAFFEFTVDRPARIYVLQRDAAQDAVAAIDRLATLSLGNVGAGRGQFLGADFEASAAYDTASGPRQLILADGKRDPWLAGWDATGSTRSVNEGNYGAIYHIKLRHTSSDGRALALVVVNSRAGEKWCDSQAGAVLVDGRLVAIPADQTKFDGLPEAVLIQKFPPPLAGNTETTEIVYSPPGASCIPTPFLLLPLAP